MTDVLAAACKHPTEKLMRGGFGGGATPPTGGLGGRTPQRLGLSDKIGSNTKSVEYGLHIKRGTNAKRRSNNQFLITGFSITKKANVSLRLCPPFLISTKSFGP
jgi:hypothetical protein